MGKCSLLVSFCLLLPAATSAQTVKGFNRPKANCGVRFFAQGLADQLRDWNQRGRYHPDDVRLEKEGAVKGRAVFMGDSITDGWDLAKYSPGKPNVNRRVRRRAQLIPGDFAIFFLTRTETCGIKLGMNGSRARRNDARNRP
jgi:hypothetical protein